MLGRYLALLALVMAGRVVTAADIGYFATQSTYTESQRLKVGMRFDPASKFSLSWASSKAKTALEDPNTSFLKLGYRYGTSGAKNFGIDLKVSDESYFFNGKSVSFKSSFPMGDETRLSLGMGLGVKTYTLSPSEFLSQGDLYAGFDHEISEEWTTGVDIVLSKFSSNSEQLSSALQGKTISNSDFESHVGLLSKDAISLYMEYQLLDLIVGASVGADQLLIDGSRNTIAEIYSEYSWSRWALSAAFARSKSDFSSTFIETTTLGLTLGF